MGFYFRKSIKVGPLRFNLSKGGVGVSAGIPGFRMGTGPRGNYVHAGANGFYYRTTLNPGQNTSGSNPAPQEPTPSLLTKDGLTEIESDLNLLFQESSGDALVKEINEKSSALASWSWILAMAVIGGIWLHPAVLAVGLVLTGAAFWWDTARRSVIIFYDFDAGQEAAFSEFVEKFENFLSVQKVWHIEAKGATSDWKKNAGAGALVTRKSTSCSVNPPKFIKANIPIPCIGVGKQTLCFLPDRLLVFAKGNSASVPYAELSIEISMQRFIETEGVPSDAAVVDHTWAFVNKSGGPDKRFKNNHQIPVCQYEAVNFRSASGLNELIQISKCGTFESLKNVAPRLVKKAG